MPIDPLETVLRGQSEAVIDASLAADTVIGEPARQEVAARFIGLCDVLQVRLIAPASFPSEADTALFQAVARGRFDASQLPAFLATLDTLAVNVTIDATEASALRKRARAIAAMLDQPSVYDATYTALAEHRGCDFWTADKRFFNAANQRRRAADGTTSPAFPFVRFIGAYIAPM